MALWSTYEIPAGAKPSELEASLKEYLKGEEKRGFNNCAMFKHEFGSPRVLYTTCTFDDILVKVMECCRYANRWIAFMPHPFDRHRL